MSITTFDRLHWLVSPLMVSGLCACGLPAMHGLVRSPETAAQLGRGGAFGLEVGGAAGRGGLLGPSVGYADPGRLDTSVHLDASAGARTDARLYASTFSAGHYGVGQLTATGVGVELKRSLWPDADNPVSFFVGGGVTMVLGATSPNALGWSADAEYAGSLYGGWALRLGEVDALNAVVLSELGTEGATLAAGPRVPLRSGGELGLLLSGALRPRSSNRWAGEAPDTWLGLTAYVELRRRPPPAVYQPR